jgi:hypothetical protein
MRRTSWVLACAFVLVAELPADAASIGVNFRRGSGEQNMEGSESAGVVPQFAWNNTDGAASGNSGANVTGPTANSIVDNNGAVVPGVSVTWTSNGTWSSPNSGPGNPNLMAGYLDDTGTAGDTVISVTGIPYAHYDIYTYVGSDANNRSGRTRLFGYFQNDRWFRTNTAPFTTFVEGTATTQPATNTGLANYTHYRSVSGGSFELRAMRGSNNVGVHGIQIVETDGSAAPDWVAAPTATPAEPAALLAGINSIGLNFVGGRAAAAEPDGHVEDDGIATGMAGIPGVAQSNWNNLTGFSGTAAAGTLLDKNGASLAGTNVTWAANNLWTIAGGTPAGVPGDEDARLMKGYLDTNDTSASTVTVSDLPPSWAQYDVYLYLDGDANAGRAGNYTISSTNDGTDVATVSDTTNWTIANPAGGTFTRANENAHESSTNPGFTPGNYVVFPGRSDLSFTLTAQGSLAGALPPRAPINAIQLVATRLIPEPGSMVLFTLGAVLLAPALRRRPQR